MKIKIKLIKRNWTQCTVHWRVVCTVQQTCGGLVTVRANPMTGRIFKEPILTVQVK